MSYKTILVHVDGEAAAQQRYRVAARLALAFDAHLTGCAATGISRFIPPDVIVQEGTALAGFCTAMRANAATAVQHFTRIVAEQGVPAFEQRVIDDDTSGIALHARYADLVVVSQPDHALPTRGSASDLPGHLLYECGRPLLVIPQSAGDTDFQGRALLAWDGSMEATRAVTGALPLLRRASSVSVLSMHHGRARPDDGLGASRGAMVHYLLRHGIAAQVLYRPDTADVGTALLSAADDELAGLLVMGGYGRSPLHESVLGGVTATVLRSMTLPLLLAH